MKVVWLVCIRSRVAGLHLLGDSSAKCLLFLSDISVFVFNIRPHPGLLPRGEGAPPRGFRLAENRPANPGARLSKNAASVAPSPWGEGWGEGGR